MLMISIVTFKDTSTVKVTKKNFFLFTYLSAVFRTKEHF